MLIQPLQKIEVIDSGKQCKAGSIGYLAYARGISGYNLVEQDIVFTKFGKSGKPRTSLVKLRTPFIDIESLNFHEDNRKSIEKIFQDYLMPHYGNENERDRKMRSIDSHTKAIPIEVKNLIEFGIWEFMAYISALSIFIEMMEQRSAGLGHGRVIRRTDISNTPVAETPLLLVGYYIAESFRNPDGRLDQKFDEYVTYFSSTRNRKAWAEKLRKKLSLNRQAVVRYSKDALSNHTELWASLRTIAADKGIKVRMPRR